MTPPAGEPAQLPGVREDRPAGALGPLVIGFVGLLTIAAVLLGDGSPLVALAPLLGGLLLLAIWLLPLRVPLLTLFILAWILEVPGDAFAEGKVQTPWRLAGALLFAKLNLTLPVDALVFSGFDLLVLCFAAVILYRHVTGSRLDRAGWVRPPAPIGQVALVSLTAVAWVTLFGLARGGSFRFALWQLIKHLYLPIVYLLMAEALRGAPDLPAIGKIVIGAGVFRAGEAIVIRWMFPSITEMPHATTHHDSVLFAVCVSILLAMLLERPTRRTLKLCGLLAPVFLAGMLANNRRLVWTQVAMVGVFFFLITPMGKTKRFLLRSLVISVVPLFIYTAAGWNSEGGRLFAPLRTVRSLFDSKVDASTRWRDWENYDLVATFKDSPLLGSGFGHPYREVVKLPDITGAYELEPYVPHNSVLGLWAFGGLLGFSLLWVIYPVGMFFTVLAYRAASRPIERIAALGAASVQISYLMQAYGDLGFGTWGPVFTLAVSYAVVGKICVANGAWSVSTGPPGRSAAT